MKVVLLYAENFEVKKEVVQIFYSLEIIAINSSQLAFEDPTVKQNIAIIATNLFRKTKKSEQVLVNDEKKKTE